MIKETSNRSIPSAAKSFFFNARLIPCKNFRSSYLGQATGAATVLGAITHFVKAAGEPLLFLDFQLQGDILHRWPETLRSDLLFSLLHKD